MLAHESARYEQREKLRVAEHAARLRTSRPATRRAGALRRTAGDMLIGVGLWLGGARRPLAMEMRSIAADDAGIAAGAC
jgi:hypothetical protein